MRFLARRHCLPSILIRFGKKPSISKVSVSYRLLRRRVVSASRANRAEDHRRDYAVIIRTTYARIPPLSLYTLSTSSLRMRRKRAVLEVTRPIDLLISCCVRIVVASTIVVYFFLPLFQQLQTSIDCLRSTVTSHLLDARGFEQSERERETGRKACKVAVKAASYLCRQVVDEERRSLRTSAEDAAGWMDGRGHARFAHLAGSKGIIRTGLERNDLILRGSLACLPYAGQTSAHVPTTASSSLASPPRSRTEDGGKVDGETIKLAEEGSARR